MGFKRGEHLVGKHFETKMLAEAIVKEIYPDSRIEHHHGMNWCIIAPYRPLTSYWRRVEGGVVR